MADQPLPENPHVARFCAGAFRQLGGTFTIGSNGVRYAGCPEPVAFRLAHKDLPQLPGSAPHEQFHSAEEWKGAMKLLDYVLARLGNRDADLIYQAFATDASHHGTADFRHKLS